MTKLSGKQQASALLKSSEMQLLLGGDSSKSSKIRALLAAGYDRSTVANLLGIKYQFVRNVELQSK